MTYCSVNFCLQCLVGETVHMTDVLGEGLERLTQHHAKAHSAGAAKLTSDQQTGLKMTWPCSNLAVQP